MTKYLGIDYGTKRVGVALSDDAGRIAFPHSIVPRDEKLVATVAELVKRRGVDGVVVGESRDRKGEANPVMDSALAFVHDLERHIDAAVSFEPEFYSTQEARHMRDGEKDIDASAAAVILQSFLDKKNAT